MMLALSVRLPPVFSISRLPPPVLVNAPSARLPTLFLNWMPPFTPVLVTVSVPT